MSREMKDSGVEWVGVIPQNWEAKKYKDIAVIMNGYPFDSASFDLNEGKPIIRIRDITSGNIETYFKGEYDEKYLVSKDDIIVGMDGDFNIRRWNNIDAILNQRCFKISANVKEVNNWIYYQLPFCLKIINDNTYATTVKHLSHYSVLNSKIVMPPANQIKEIVSYLDNSVMLLDTIIAKTKSTIEDYKLLKQSIITEAVTKGLDKNVEMKDSGIEWIGEVPKQWNVRKISSVIDIIGSGTTPKTSDESLYFGNINWIQSGDINGGIITSVSKKITQNALSSSSALRIYNSDFVVVAMYGASIGNVSISKINACVNQACCVLQGKFFNVEFLYYIMKAVKSYLVFSAVGGTQPNISQEKIKQLRIPFPSIDEQDKIAEKLNEKCFEIDMLLTQKTSLLEDLESYKKSLIYEYVTGKKEVE